MSSKKRRAARKIDRMARMDKTRMRMSWPKQYSIERQRAFIGCMQALGRKLTRMGLRDRTIAVLFDAGTDLTMRVHTKTIQWFGMTMVLGCDGMCKKAWGVSQRPNVSLGPDPDDVAYLADSELEDAPFLLRTSEGGHTKPRSPGGMNKWCARECERSDIASSASGLRLPDFSVRLLNQPWKHNVINPLIPMPAGRT